MNWKLVLLLLFIFSWNLSCSRKRFPTVSPHKAVNDKPSEYLSQESSPFRLSFESDEGAVVTREGQEVPISIQSLGSRQAREEFHKLNLSIIAEYKSSPSSRPLRQKLENYFVKFVHPCLKNPSACLEYKFLKTSSYTPAVLKILGRLENMLSLDEQMLVLRLAFDVSNSIRDEELEQIFLEKSLSYLKSKKGLSKEEAGDQAREAVRLVIGILQNLSLDRRQNIESFVKEIEPWKFDNTKNEFLNELRRELLPWFFKNYKGPSASGLDQVFDKYLSEFQQQLKKDTSKRLADKGLESAFRNLGMSQEWLNSDKETLFIIDQVFLDKINIQQANLILKSFSNISPDHLFGAIRGYLELQLLQNNLDSSAFLGKVLGDEKVRANSKIFDLVIGQGKRLSPNWDRFHDRVGHLEELYKESAGTQLKSSQSANEALLYFKSLKKTVRISSIYPNMMALIYYMSKYNFRDRVYFGWFSVEINSNTEFERFFTGGHKSWFPFTSEDKDESQLTEVEILYAFSYALATRTFEAYGISVDDFLVEVATRLMQPLVNYFNVFVQELDKKYGPGGDRKDGFNAITFEQFKDFCQATPARKEVFTMDNLLETASLGYRGLIDKFGYNYYGLAILAILGDGELLPIDANDTLEKMRLEYSSFLNKVKLLYKIALPLYGSQRLEKTAKILRFYEQKRKAYYGRMIQLTELMDTCVDHVFPKEMARRNSVLVTEKEYLRSVYNGLKELETHPQALSGLNSKIRFSGIKNYSGFDNFSLTDKGKAIYRYHRLDFVMRMARSLQKDFPQEVEVVIPNDFAQSFIGDPIYENQSPSLTLIADGSFEEFYRSVFHRLVAPYKGDRFVEWFGSDDIDEFARLIIMHYKTIATLYKGGEVEMYDYNKGQCAEYRSFDLLEKNCNKKYNLTSQKLLDHMKKIKTLVEFHRELSTNEIPYLGLRSLVGFYLITEDNPIGSVDDRLFDLFFDVFSREPKGIYDFAFELLSQENLGIEYTPDALEMRSSKAPLPYERKGRRAHAIEFALAQKTSQSLAISVSPSTQNLLESEFKSMVSAEFGPLRRVEAAIDREIKATGQNALRLNYFMNEEPIEVPLLKPTARKTKRIEEQFREKSFNYYKEAFKGLEGDSL